MFALLMGLRSISPADLHQQIQAGGARAIDVNSAGSWAQAHVPGAMNLDPAAFVLIALQPGANSDDYGDLIRLERPTPIGWAVAGSDVAALRAGLEAAGFSLTPAQPGSRVTPAGTTLEWEAFGFAQYLPEMPFFITWGKSTAHPSTTSPTGCRLVSFRIVGPIAPNLAQLEKLRDTLALPVILERGDRGDKVTMTVELDCPKGRVVFAPRGG